MPTTPWKVPSDVLETVREIQHKHHLPRLENCEIAACFVDTKPFVKNKLNLGKVTKFSPLAKLWHNEKNDFCIVLCADLWHAVLTQPQREALLDLHLTRCEVEYVPEMEDGKILKDEWGRIQYTNEIMFDDSGEPKWKVLPLDLEVFTSNVRRYGLWLDMIQDFSKVCNEKDLLDY